MTKRFQQILAFSFGVVFVSVMLMIAIFTPYPSGFQLLVYRIVLGLAAAGVASVIPGFLNIEVRGIVRAGGAIAVFVVIFLFNPATLSTQGHEIADGVFVEQLSGTEEEAEYYWKQAKISFRFPKTGWEISTKAANKGLGDITLVKTDDINTQIQIHISVLDDKYRDNWDDFRNNTSETWKNTIEQFGDFETNNSLIDGRSGFEMSGMIIGSQQQKKRINLTYLPMSDNRLLEFHLTRNEEDDSKDEHVYRLILSTVKMHDQ